MWSASQSHVGNRSDGVLHVEFQDVTIFNYVISADLLCIEIGGTPQSCELEVDSDLSMDQCSDVMDGGTVSHCVWTAHVGVLAGDLRIHTYNTKPIEQPHSEPVESVTCFG